jgi:flagella basal body P-ring formation protein FlgA
LLASRTADTPVSRHLAHRVADRIATDWGVARERLRLEWGRSSAEHAPADSARFRVLGRGTGGWLVVVFDPAETRASAVRVRVGVEQPVTVAVRALPAGHRLLPGDLREEVQVHWGPPGDSALAVAGPGWELRRAVAAGEVMAAPTATPPPDVLAGEPVRFAWRRGEVEVSVVGIALHSARRGERVRARLEERPARLTGTVVAPGVAELGGEGVR